MKQNSSAAYTELQQRLAPLISQLKVMIVDDMPANIDAYRMILLELGVPRKNIQSTTNGLSAITRMQRTELILADWNMPILDGLEFAKRVREYLNHKQPIILMITAEAEADMEQVRPWVDAFLRKPTTNETIRRMVLSVLGKKVADPDHPLTIS